MRKVNLRMNENYKYEIIKKLVDCNGNKKNATVKLNCTTRTINRMIISYTKYGRDGFVHGSRNRIPVTAIDPAIKEQVTSLYQNEFTDTNFRHFGEILHREYDISVSETTINLWLRELHVLSPKAKRTTKKRVKKELKMLTAKVSSSKQKNEAILALDAIISDDPHPRRSRSAYFGEMIQMDASVMNGFLIKYGIYMSLLTMLPMKL